jgi:hypothetical protein
MSLFSAHQAEDAIRVRRLIRDGTIADRLGDPEVSAQLRHYVSQLNFVAMLRARGLLGDQLVRDLFYEPAQACWERCATSFIREVRATQNEEFARELQEWIGAPDP